ncbi:MAG: pitrilysin family protein [Pseudomonadota bacterium]
MRRFYYFALVSVLGLLAIGQALATPVIQHWQTANGLRVYFVPAPEIPMIDIRLVFDAGSSRDQRFPGLASLTAGLLDEGSGDWDADAIANRFEDFGAEYSASVLRDMAWISLRSLSAAEFFDPALEAFIRVVTSPSFPERDFQRLKNIMRVAIQGQNQEPDAIAEKAFYRAVYGDHPFANPVNGTEQSIDAIALEDVKDFHRRYLVARNAVLVLVGDINKEDAERVARRIGKRLPAGKPAPTLPSVEALKVKRNIHIPFPSTQVHVYMGQPGIRRGDPDYFPLYVGNHMLGGSGFNSRLVKEVRVKRGLSYSIYSYFFPKIVKGPFEIVLQTRVDQAKQAVTLTRQTIEEFIQNGPKKGELEASIKNITGGFPLRIDSNADIVSYLALIGFYQLPLSYLDTFNTHIRSVNKETIQDAFKRRVHLDEMVTVIVGGEPQERDEHAADE